MRAGTRDHPTSPAGTWAPHSFQYKHEKETAETSRGRFYFPLVLLMLSTCSSHRKSFLLFVVNNSCDTLPRLEHSSGSVVTHSLPSTTLFTGYMLDGCTHTSTAGLEPDLPARTGPGNVPFIILVRSSRFTGYLLYGCRDTPIILPSASA